MPPRVSPTSAESLVEIPILDLNVAAHSPASQTAAARAAAPTVVAAQAARNLFGDLPRPSPGDPRYYEEEEDVYDGEDVLQDMVRDNNEYAEDNYNAGEDEVLPTSPDVINIDDEPVFDDELVAQA